MSDGLEVLNGIDVNNDPVNFVDPEGLIIGSSIAKIIGKIMGKTAQESHIVGKMADAATGVAIEGAGGIPVNYSKPVGYAADALQAYGGVQAIGIGSVLIGYTSATWLPPAFALAGGLELGFAFNHFYERLSGQPLGADFYDWIHRNDNCQ